MLLYDTDLCGECGGCVAVCAYGALELLPSGLKIEPHLCSLCEDCCTFCPTGALRIEVSTTEAALSSPKQKPDRKDG